MRSYVLQHFQDVLKGLKYSSGNSMFSSSDVCVPVSATMCVFVSVCISAWMWICECVCGWVCAKVCNSLLGPELPAADMSNNPGWCWLTHPLVHTNTHLKIKFPAVWRLSRMSEREKLELWKDLDPWQAFKPFYTGEPNKCTVTTIYLMFYCHYANLQSGKNKQKWVRWGTRKRHHQPYYYIINP